MAFQIPIKYFNSFWLKKVVGDQTLSPKDTDYEIGPPQPWNYESTVTTQVDGGGVGEGTNASPAPYVIPTWPGLPWGDQLTTENPDDSNEFQPYPCFPWGGRRWWDWSNGALPSCNAGSRLNQSPSPEEGSQRNWAIEEARIRGGFNNTTVDFGVKAYIVNPENQQENRFNTLIYSGIFNSITGVNDTNVFSTATNITKSLEPQNGSIQKLYAYDTNLTVFQENKVSSILIDKDAIYTGEGSAQVTATNAVLGQTITYAGEYGISKNPESWAQYGLRQYFSDKNRGTIMRLGGDGLTEISGYGMSDYFKDSLELVSDGVEAFTITYDIFNPGISCPDGNCLINSFTILPSDCDCTNIELGSLIEINGNTVPNLYVSDVSTNPSGSCSVRASRPFYPSFFGLTEYPTIVNFVSYDRDRIVGGFDTWNKNYVVSIQNFEPTNAGCGKVNRDNVVVDDLWNGQTYSTIGFDESINGWVSFYSYRPTLIDSIQNNFYSINGIQIWKHYDDGGTSNNYENFYGVRTPASIEFIFNTRPSVNKNFQTLGYEGSNGWESNYFVSDLTEEIFNPFSSNYIAHRDVTNPIYSYQEGEYTDINSGYTMHAGFNLKENKYVSNLVNNSGVLAGEVVFGDSMSGIKGHYATVRLSTDQTTDVGGMKELFAVNTKYVVSSI